MAKFEILTKFTANSGQIKNCWVSSEVQYRKFKDKKTNAVDPDEMALIRRTDKVHIISQTCPCNIS